MFPSIPIAESDASNPPGQAAKARALKRQRKHGIQVIRNFEHNGEPSRGPPNRRAFMRQLEFAQDLYDTVSKLSR
jgi:hypothetical protein